MRWKKDIFFNLACRPCLFKLHVIANHRDKGKKTKAKGKITIVIMRRQTVHAVEKTDFRKAEEQFAGKAISLHFTISYRPAL